MVSGWLYRLIQAVSNSSAVIQRFTFGRRQTMAANLTEFDAQTLALLYEHRTIHALQTQRYRSCRRLAGHGFCYEHQPGQRWFTIREEGVSEYEYRQRCWVNAGRP